MTYAISRCSDDEVPTLERYILDSPSGLSAAFVPQAGMVGTSLAMDGVELLGRRGGLADYVERGKTFGIPLLAPWANRLARPEQSFSGRSWEVRTGSPGVHADEFGQAMHGLLAASDAWVVEDHNANSEGAQLSARLNFDESLDVFNSFPFVHELRVNVILVDATLRIITTLRATGDSPVPVAFGWHPYFAFADTPRPDWVIDAPFTQRAELNDVKIPTGQVVRAPIEQGPLNNRAYDDVFVHVPVGARATIASAHYEVGVLYERGYGTAVVFAPTAADVVCFEPMTAPTDPFGGNWPIISVDPGDEYSASYAIEIVRSAGQR